MASTCAHADWSLHDEPVPGLSRDAGYLPAADGTPLAYVAYHPTGEGRFPTVAWFDVYGAGSMPPLPLVRTWTDAGFAFVGASLRGTSCSHGDYVPFGPHEGGDGASLVEWAARQSWSTGKVGLIGNSQPGIVQFAIAATHPPHLAAIAPGGTVRSLYADGWYLGGIYNAAFAAHWSSIDQPGASRAGADLRIKLGDADCDRTAQRIGPTSLLRDLARHPFDGDWHRRASPFDRAPQVEVPTLMVQSWTDPAVGSSALGTFERVHAQHKRLFVLSGGHEAYLYSTAQAEVHRWMDRWVKGVDNGVDAEPRVRLDFLTRVVGTPQDGDVIKVEAGWTSMLPDYPAPQTQWLAYQLTGDGKLDEHATAPATRRYWYPGGTELPGDNVQFAVPPLEFGSLAWRGPAVAQDTAIVGAPQLRLFASLERGDTDFMVALHDVAPGGAVTFLQRGWLRASHRTLDAARSTAQLAFHPHEREERLQAGKVYAFELSLLPLVHVLRAGHALELLIAAPSTIPTPGWGLIPLMLPGFNTIRSGGVQASTLRVPVVPDLHAQAPEPACGELPFQPCRKAP